MRRESFFDLLAFVFVAVGGAAWLYDSYTLPSSTDVWCACPGFVSATVFLFLQGAFVFGAAESISRGWGRRQIERSLARPEVAPLETVLARSIFRDCPPVELGLNPGRGASSGRLSRQVRVARFWLTSGARNLRALSVLALLVGLLGVSTELIAAARGIALTGTLWLGGVEALALEILRLVGATIFVALPALWLSDSLSASAARLESAGGALREGRGRASAAAL